MSYLLKGGLIVTFNQANQPVSFKADVLVDGTTIAKVAEEIQVSPEVKMINCTGKWITPGMVDLHRHLWMTVLRGNHGDWLLSEYLVKNSWHVQADLTAAEVRIGQLAGCLDAIHNGVTTTLDHFHAVYSPEIADAALEVTVQSGARVVFCPSRASAPTKLLPEFEWGHEPDMSNWQWAKFKEWAARDKGKLSTDGRVTLGLGYDIVAPWNIPQSQEALKEARSWPAAIITAHVVQGTQVNTWSEAGILGPDVIFSHCNVLSHRTSPDDKLWSALKNHGSGVVSTPVDELGMAIGNPVALDAVRRGVKSGLGADSTSINGGDMFSQMRMILQWQRGQEFDKVLTAGATQPSHNKWRATDAFRLATLGGAEALNMSHLIGTVEEGKKADLLIVDAESPNLAACLDPFLGFVFHASDADIVTVLVDGEIVKHNNKITRFDWPTVAKELRDASAAIHKRWPAVTLESIWNDYYAKKGTPAF